MHDLQTLDNNAYVTVKGHYAVVNEGTGYAIIHTETKQISARNITSFLDCVKTLEYLLGDVKESDASCQTHQAKDGTTVETVIEATDIGQAPAPPKSTTYRAESTLQKPIEQLDELALAALLSLVTYFNDMSGKICRHHKDHHASSEEAEVIASYYRKTARKAAQVETENELIAFIEHVKHLKQQVSRYQHESHKYRWSTGLEKVLDKLQSIMDSVRH